jgi:hypothetical protein
MDQDRIDRLEGALAGALAEIDRLKSLEAIRDCIQRVCRGIDRLDADILRSAFHLGAKIDMGKIYQGDVDGWIPAAVAHQKSQSQRQHMPGSIRIRIDGDEAVAETYELDRHKTPMNGGFRDLVLGARTLDRLSRRDGEWKIVDRTKVMDWGRIISADETVYVNSPLEHGGDDETDASYRLFS